MYHKQCKEASDSIEMGTGYSDTPVIEITKEDGDHMVKDHGLEQPIIFRGSKPQCVAFVQGIAHGAKARHAVFCEAI